jgi:hypothetical protein
VRGTDPNAGAGNLGGDGQPLVMGELSSPQLGNYDDVRRNLGGGGRGGGSTFVIVLLVLAVAAGFWYLAIHRSGDDETQKAATAKPALEPPKKPATATKPSELPNPPNPTAIGEPAKPSIEAQKALEAPKQQPSGVSHQPSAPETKQPAPKVDRPKPEAHKPQPQPVKLPHLPTPPPPDDQP